MTSQTATTRAAKAARAAATAIAVAVVTALSVPAVAGAAFGVESMDTNTHTPLSDGSGPAVAHVDQAGSHADSTLDFTMNTKLDERGDEIPDGALKNVLVDLPAGFSGNPQAAPRCDPAQFNDLSGGSCPINTQVGVTTTELPGGSHTERFFRKSPVYNLVPAAGEVAAFGFYVLLVPVKVSIEVRSDGDYGVRAVTSNVSQGANVYSQSLTLWGVPADPIHDHERFTDPLLALTGAPSNLPRRPFLSLPPACPGPLSTTLGVMAWGTYDWLTYSDFTDDPATGIATGPTGCDRVPFEASMEMRPDTTRASTPAGFTARFRTEYGDNPDGIANAHVKDVSVTLPEGVSISPAAAEGLGGCTDAQLALGSKAEPTCPSSSKIGDVRIETPVLDEDVTGEVYLRAPTADRLFGMAIVARANGVLVKLPGDVDPDPGTGQITTTFRSNPQLPFTQMTLSLKSGARSPLVNPPTCGVKTTTTRITSWAGHSVVSSDSFTIDRAENGAPCGPQPFDPAIDAGSESAAAGARTGFSLIVSRPAGHQDLTTLAATMPKGLLADISSVERCADGQADAGTCRDDSRIGRVEVAAGEGASPLWVPQPGRAQPTVHLAGPYQGAPFSLSVVVPAQAGPFDLGRVVVRTPLHIDRSTAQVSTAVVQSRIYDRHGNLERVVDGRMPTILAGVVLDQREIRVRVDRPGFMVNPTNCAAKRVTATLGSAEGQLREVSDRFQVGSCAALPFAPRMSLALTGRGQTRTGEHPGVKAVVRQRGVGEAGIARAAVTLPPSLALDPANAQALCEFEDGTKPDLERHCPGGSVVGRAVAHTPLLDRPLAGRVYFVKNVERNPRTGALIRKLPMLVVALRGEIAINLVGKSSTSRSGRLINTFASVPDAPIQRFDLTVAGGRNGILAVTRTRAARIDLCARPKSHVARVDLDGQNGKAADFGRTMKTPCSAKRAKKKKQGRGR